MHRLTQHEINAELARFEDDGNPNHTPIEQDWPRILVVDLHEMEYRNSLARFFQHAWENPQVSQLTDDGVEHVTIAPYRAEDYEPAPELESAYFTGQRKGSGYDPHADWDQQAKDGGR